VKVVVEIGLAFGDRFGASVAMLSTGGGGVGDLPFHCRCWLCVCSGLLLLLLLLLLYLLTEEADDHKFMQARRFEAISNF
jgi:hypothetical protein